jgi:hypothetical protein
MTSRSPIGVYIWNNKELRQLRDESYMEYLKKLVDLQKKGVFE